MSPGAIKAGEAYVQLNADDTQARAALQRFETKFQATARHVNQINAGIRQATGAAMVAAVASVPVINSFVTFDDAIRAAGARAEATEQEFQRLRNAALALGRTSGYTATEVAKLMNVLGTSGFKPDQIIAMAPSVLTLARAGDADVGIAAQGVADAINVFKLPAETATAIADKFAVAANKSAITLTSLGETFTYVAPVANKFGMSLDKALALSAALGQLGIRGSEAGTALRRMTVELGAHEAALNSVFGVSGRDAAGELRPVIDVISDIQTATANLPGGQNIEKLNEFFGLLGITAAAGLGDSTVLVKDLEKALAEAGGTAERTAAQMDAGIGGAWRRVRGAAESAAIAFGEALGPALGAAARVVELVAERFTAWVANNRELATTIGAAVVAVFALAAAGLAVLAVFKLVALAVVAVKALAAAVALLLNPMTWVAVLAGILMEKWLRTSEVGKAVAAEVAAAFRRMGESVSLALEGVTAALKMGDIRTAWDVALLGMQAVWYDFVAMLLDGWHHFTNLFRDAWRDSLEWVRTAWAKTQAWIATKLIATAEVFVLPIMEASDFIGATEGKADKMKAEFKGYKDTVAQMKDEEVKAITRELEADKKATLERQAAQRKEYEDGAGIFRDQIREIVARLAREATAAELFGGGIGGAKGSASPELGGRPGGVTGGKLEHLGAAVQGAYQSADFASSFGRGKATDYGRDQLRKTDEMIRLLIDIRDKMQFAVFQ